MALLASIPPLGVSAFTNPGALSPLTPAARFGALSGSAGLLPGESAVVQLSGAGQLLSAVAGFASRLTLIGPTAQASAESGNFGGVAIAASRLADNFNALRAVLDGLGNFLGGFAQDSPVTRLRTAMDEALAREFDSGESPLVRLSDLGIELEAVSTPLAAGRVHVDFAKLAGAFETDPLGSARLLGAAVDALSQAAEDAIGPLGSSSAQTSSRLLALDAVGLLTGGDTDTSRAWLRDFSELFALAGLSDASGTSRTRLLLALNQFSLVATLVT